MLGAFRTTFIGASGPAEAEAPLGREITVFGDAQIDTSQSKFGGSSVQFDGTGDQLQIDISDFFETSGNFTVEGWYRFSSFPASGLHDLFMFGIVNVGSRVGCYIDPSAKVFVDFRGGTPDIGASSPLSANTWYHIALVQNSGVCTLYINGQSSNSCTPGIAVGGNGIMQISGYRLNGVVNRSLNGHVDEFRVSDTARYTGNFTAPTSAFTGDANTLLLIHADGADGSTDIIDSGGA